MRVVDARQHHASADGTDRLGEALVLVAGEHPCQIFALSIFNQREDAQYWHIQASFDFFGALEGVVQCIQQQGQADADEAGQQGGDDNDQGFLRFDRLSRHYGLVDHTCIGAVQVGGCSSLFQASHEGVIQRAVTIDFALQFAQFELLARDFLDL